jgi:hypothetical protein
MSRLLALLAATALLQAQEPVPAARAVGILSIPAQYRGTPDPPFKGEAARLAREIVEKGRAYADLEELCDDIGPRLTGSERLRQAQAWAMARLKAYGAENVHEEAHEFPRAWTRGVARARLLNGNGQELRIAQMAWSPATPGPVHGEVALLEAATLAEFRQQLPQLNGKIVLIGRQPRPGPGEDRAAFYREFMTVYATASFKAALSDSGKQGELLGMHGNASGSGPRAARVPTAFITSEHANLLKRLIARGRRPEVEIELGGQLGEKPLQVHNVVGELRGSEKPEEVVIVGGHLDSWDLGTGATDNGTGSVAAIETLRAMKALGLKPRRTLRVILFFGEEQGLLGSKAYVQAHEKELKNIQAVLINDMGGGRIVGWPSMGHEAWIPLLGAAMAPANALGCQEISPYKVPADSDHWPFFQKGVPAFFATQDIRDYFTATHHTQLDTFDHVVKADFLQGCQVLAITAWGFLQMPERVPHLQPQ